MTKYFTMMSVRVVCFVLMVVITPYGWHTWILAVGAVVLPYLAVVVANVASDAGGPTALPPERQLPAATTANPAPAVPEVITIREADPPPPPVTP